MRRDCAGQSLRIRTRTRDLNLPVVAHPDTQVAGDGHGVGVGDVEANLEGLGGVAPRAHHAARIVRLQGGAGRGLLVKADEVRRHAVAGVVRLEEGEGGKDGGKKNAEAAEAFGKIHGISFRANSS